MLSFIPHLRNARQPFFVFVQEYKNAICKIAIKKGLKEIRTLISPTLL